MNSMSKTPGTKLLQFLAMLVFCLPLPTHTRAACLSYNYADEFVVSNFQFIRQTNLDNGLVEVEISADIKNTGASELNKTTAQPDFRESDLGVVVDEESFKPFNFFLVQAFETVSAVDETTNMILTLPDDRLNELLVQLNDGTLPMQVYGEETLVLQPDVLAFSWHAGADGDYQGVGTTPQIGHVFASHPFEPLNANASDLAELDWTYTPREPGSLLPARCTGRPYDGQRVYVYESLSSGRVDSVGMTFTDGEYIENGSEFPQSLRHATVAAFAYERPGNDLALDYDCAANASTITQVELEQNDISALDVGSIVQRGTFCSDEAAYLDQPVAQSRFIAGGTESGIEVPVEAMEESLDVETLLKDVQPVRVNGLKIAGLRVSGQVQGYALKPGLTVRVHPDGIEVEARIENDLSMALQVTAEEDIELIDAQELPLETLCFPLPPIPIGVAELQSSLLLEHKLDLMAKLKVGATVGIQKQFSGGYSMTWDQRNIPGQEFSSERLYSDRPLSLTPPLLTGQSSADASLATHFRTTLSLGDNICSFGGPYLQTTLSVDLHADPSITPWWQLGHDADIFAGLTLDLFGFDIVDVQAPRVNFPGSESLSAPAGADPAPGSGQNQRWAVNIQDETSPGGKIWVTDLSATADGGAVAITSNGVSGGQERLLHISDRGELLWDKQYAGTTTHVSHVDARDDNTVLVAGNETGTKGFWLALHDPDGNPLWNRKFALSNAMDEICSLDAMTSFTSRTGEQGIILAGTSGSTTDQTARPCLARLDRDGNPLWSRVADELLDPATELAVSSGEWKLYDVLHTRDDGFVFVGYFQNRTADAVITTRPVAVKLNAQGNIAWQAEFTVPDDHARIGIFKAIDQTETGDFYLTGSIGGTVYQTGGLLVASLSEEGTQGKGAIVYYAKDSLGSYLDTNSDPNHWSDDSTVAAETAYDSGLDIVAVDGGAILVGVLGVNQEAWAIRVNKHLGVEWFNSYDGIYQDSLSSLARTETGLIAAGINQSVVMNSALQGLAGKATLMVMKVPFEGLVNDVDNLAPDLGMFHRYVLPTVFQGPASYSESPVIRATQTGTLTLVEGQVEDRGSNDTLLQPSSSAICQSLLTERAGAINEIYACDTDGDELNDDVDNCPFIENPDQLDLDADGMGDTCDDDIDGDEIDNSADNCTLRSNPAQRDTDGDGYGNFCDADFNNDNVVNFVDLGYIKSVFFTADADADMNGDGVSNFVDLGLLRSIFFLPPGPGAQDF